MLACTEVLIFHIIHQTWRCCQTLSPVARSRNERPQRCCAAPSSRGGRGTCCHPWPRGLGQQSRAGRIACAPKRQIIRGISKHASHGKESNLEEARMIFRERDERVRTVCKKKVLLSKATYSVSQERDEVAVRFKRTDLRFVPQ